MSTVRHLVTDQLRTPDSNKTAHRGKASLPMRHTTAKRATLAVATVAVLAGLIAPVVTSMTTSTPVDMADDAAVIALLTYTRGLDGSPATQKDADEAATTLTFHELSDGSTRVSRTSTTGTCYYLIIPATADAAPTPVRAGTDADCQP